MKTTLLAAALATLSIPTLSAATGSDTISPSSDGWAQHGAAVSHTNGTQDPLIVANSANANRTYLRFGPAARPPNYFKVDGLEEFSLLSGYRILSAA